MARNLKSGILITGDASGAVKATKLTREEMDKLNSTTRKANKAAKDHNDTIKKMSGIAATGAKALAGLGAAGAAAMAAIFQSTRGPIDELGKLSRRLGTTTEKLAGLQLAAEFNGASANTLSTALEKMQKRLGEAADGTGQAKAALDKMGLSTSELLKLDAAEQFKVIADSISGLDTQAEKAAATADIFSNQGLKLLNTLEQGADGLNAITEEAKRYGIALNAVDVAKVEAANDAMLRAEKAIDGAKNKITVGLAPVVEELANRFANMAAESDGFSDVIKTGFEGAVNIAGVFADGMRGIEVVIKGVEVAALGFTSAFAGALSVLTEGVVAHGNNMVEFILKPFKEALKLIAPFSKLATDTLKKLEGFKLETPKAIEGFYQAQVDGLRIAQEELSNLLIQDLPSEVFKAKLDEIMTAAEVRAKAFVENTKTVSVGGDPTGNELYLQSLQEEKELLKLTNKERYIQINLRKLNANATEEEKVRVRELSSALFDSQNDTEKVSDDYAKAWEKATERIDATFAQAWEGAFDSFSDFSDSILDSFKSLLAEMAHQALTKPIVMQFQNELGGSLGVPGAEGGLGLESLGLLAAGGLVTSSLATVFDSSASNARRRNNLGLLTGGLGFLLPTSVFGGGPSDKTQAADINFDTFGTFTHGLGGDKFSQENSDAALVSAEIFGRFAQYLEGKTGTDLQGGARFTVGNRDGIRVDVNGERVATANNIEEALDAGLAKLSELAGVSVGVYEHLRVEGENLADAMFRVDAQFNSVSEASNALGFNLANAGTTMGELIPSLQGFATILPVPTQTLLNITDDLIARTGGLEAFSVAVATFEQNFLTVDEKIENSSRRLTEALGDLANDGLPATRDGFKELLQAQNANTEAGRENIATLLKVQNQAHIYYSLLESLPPKVEDALDSLDATVETFGNNVEIVTSQIEVSLSDLRSATDSALSTLRSAVSDEINRLKDEEQILRSDLSGAESTTNSLLSRLNELTEAEKQASENRLLNARASIQQEAQLRLEANNLALSAARQGLTALERELSGISSALETNSFLPQELRRGQALNSLRSALSTGDLTGAGAAAQAAARIDANQFGSSADLLKAQIATQSLLSELQKEGEGQLSTAEKTVKRLELQIDTINKTSEMQIAAANLHHLNEVARLDKISSDAKKFIDGARGIEEQNSDIYDIVNLGLDSLAEEARLRGEIEDGNFGEEIERLNDLVSNAEDQVNLLRGIDATLKSVDGALRNFDTKANTETVTEAQRQQVNDILLANAMLFTPGISAIPKFADGGSYSGGMALVGERGPELINFNSPGQITNNADLRELLSQKELIAEIRRLRQELNELKAYSRITARSTKKSKELHQKWDETYIPTQEVV